MADRMKLKSIAGILWLLALTNGVYLLAFGDPTLAYFLNILAHLAFGAALIILVLWNWRRAGWFLLPVFLVAAGIGIAIVVVGGTRNHQSVVYAHAAAAFL